MNKPPTELITLTEAAEILGWDERVKNPSAWLRRRIRAAEARTGATILEPIDGRTLGVRLVILGIHCPDLVRTVQRDIVDALRELTANVREQHARDLERLEEPRLHHERRRRDDGPHRGEDRRPAQGAGPTAARRRRPDRLRRRTESGMTRFRRS